MSRFALIFITALTCGQFARAQERAPDEPKKTVMVKFDNISLPVYLKWYPTGQPLEKGGEVMWNKPEKIQSGRIVIQLMPRYGNGWIQGAQWRVNGGPLSERTIYAHELVLKENDTIEVKCAEPVAPWNGVVVRLKGEPILVSSPRPSATLDLEKWEAGKGGAEDLPNTPLMIVKLTDKVLALRVATHVVGGKGERTDHLTVVPSVQLKDLKQDELAKKIEEALKDLRAKYSPEGRSFQQELDDAAKLLKDGRGAKPKPE